MSARGVIAEGLSREQALALGFEFYVPSVACDNGHVGPWFTLNDKCLQCEQGSDWIAKKYPDPEIPAGR